MNATGTLTAGDSFDADVTAHGARVHIHAETLEALLKTLAQFGITGGVTAPAPKAEAPGKPATAARASAVSPPATATATPSTSATGASPSEAPPKSESAAPADKPSAVSAPAAASGDYAPVKAAILALAKTPNGPAKIVTLLGQFGVDHGSKLTAEQYPAFLEAAAQVPA